MIEKRLDEIIPYPETGVIYRIKVKALGDWVQYRDSNFSNSIGVQFQAIQTPEHLNGDGGVLTWESITGASGYRVEYKDGDTFETLDDVTTPYIILSEYSTTLPTVCQVRVIAISGVQGYTNSLPSEPIEVDISVSYVLITNTSQDSQTIAVAHQQYSANTFYKKKVGSDTEFTLLNINEWVTLEYGESVLLYGDNPNGLEYLYSAREYYGAINIGPGVASSNYGSCKISGNIMSLINRNCTTVRSLNRVFTPYNNGQPNVAFYGSRIDASHLQLPIANYFRAFCGCWLSKFPAFTSSTTDSCYIQMFAHALFPQKELPLLPATTLADKCYQSMFSYSSACISTTQTEEYSVPWRVPPSGTGTEGLYPLIRMFEGTSSSVITPTINTTYYIKGA